MRTGYEINQNGFSLFEVLVAIAIFSVFLAAYVVSEGQSLTASQNLETELVMRKLGEEVLTEAILNPPEYSKSLTFTPEEKRFEDDRYERYRYTVEYQLVEIPNLADLTGKSEENQGNQAVQTRIFDQFKRNIEEMIWQVGVRVKDTNSSLEFYISTWVRNRKARVQISI